MLAQQSAKGFSQRVLKDDTKQKALIQDMDIKCDVVQKLPMILNVF